LFSSEGDRAFITTTVDEVVSASFLDLPGETPVPLALALDGESLQQGFYPGPNGSVLAQTVRAGELHVLSQVFADGSPRVDLSDTTLDYRINDQSLDANILALDYETALLDIVRIEPYARHRLPNLNTATDQGFAIADVIGQHVYYQAGDVLRVAGIDAEGALIDGPISEPGEETAVCGEYDVTHPVGKLAYLSNGRTELVLVDLAASPAQVVARIPASTPEATFSCPKWKVDSAGLAVAESGDAGSKIYFVDWQGSTPDTPELVLESEMVLNVVTFSF
jgi:hypothetical protein